MTINAKFVHVNLVSQDWNQLAEFYQQVFGCVPVPPERDLLGRWLDASTGIPDAHIRGIHLRLPGCGDDGPTLEVFQYDHHLQRAETAANRPGLGHIALTVDDAEAARDAVIAAGGGILGETVTVKIPGAGSITFVYATDTEGNIIELQTWA